MSCGCKCSYCCSCNATPREVKYKDTDKGLAYLKKQKGLYTKKQAD